MLQSAQSSSANNLALDFAIFSDFLENQVSFVKKINYKLASKWVSK